MSKVWPRERVRARAAAIRDQMKMDTLRRFVFSLELNDPSSRKKTRVVIEPPDLGPGKKTRTRTKAFWGRVFVRNNHNTLIQSAKREQTIENGRESLFLLLWDPVGSIVLALSASKHTSVPVPSRLWSPKERCSFGLLTLVH